MATRLRWLGHSALHIQTDKLHILIDPFLTGNPKAAISVKEAQADFILVTHGHGDHLGDSIDIAKRTGAMVIANYEISEWLRTKGVAKVHGLQHGGGFNFPFGRAKLTLAFHGSVLPDGTYGGNPCGVLLCLQNGLKIYHAGDTGLFGDMKLIGEEGLDLAALPIGDNYTMGPDDALKAIQMLQPKKVLPIHYNTFDLIAQDAQAWAERVKQTTQAQPLLLQPGVWADL